MAESLRTTHKTDKIFEDLRTKYGGEPKMNKIDFLHTIINYFKLTKADPNDTDFEKTSSAVKELRQTFVGFMRTEKEIRKKALAPMIKFQELIYKEVELSEHRLKDEIRRASKGTTELKLPDSFLKAQVITDPEIQLELDVVKNKIQEIKVRFPLSIELKTWTTNKGQTLVAKKTFENLLNSIHQI